MSKPSIAVIGAGLGGITAVIELTPAGPSMQRFAAVTSGRLYRQPFRYRYTSPRWSMCTMSTRRTESSTA